MEAGQQRRLREWLVKPEAREFQKYLREYAAEFTALAGNKMHEAEDTTWAEAQELASQSKWVLWLDELMDKMKHDDYTFETSILGPKTVT